MSSHEVQDEAAGAVAPAREPQWGRPLPLNSKRLTAVLLKQLARGLDVPATASPEEVRQLIEGKLAELGRDPRNVQVILRQVDQGTQVGLQDNEGVFLEVAQAPPDRERPAAGTEEGAKDRKEGGPRRARARAGSSGGTRAEGWSPSPSRLSEDSTRGCARASEGTVEDELPPALRVRCGTYKQG